MFKLLKKKKKKGTSNVIFFFTVLLLAVKVCQTSTKKPNRLESGFILPTFPCILLV